MPEVLALYNVSGPEDFFIQVAVTDSAHLQRLIVDHLATRPEVGHAQTHLIFDRPLTAPVRPLPPDVGRAASGGRGSGPSSRLRAGR